MRKIFWLLPLLIAGVAAWFFQFHSPAASSAHASHRALPQVRIATVHDTQSSEQLPLVAKLKARQSVQLALVLGYQQTERLFVAALNTLDELLIEFPIAHGFLLIPGNSKI